MNPQNQNPAQGPTVQERDPLIATSPPPTAPTRTKTQPITSSVQEKVPPSVPSRAISNERAINFAIKWTCGILTVAASIVFGIWAPLSYKATTSGNASNDEAQSSMMNVISSNQDLAVTANEIASNALKTAAAQATALSSMQAQIGRMGELGVLDFCITQSTLSACSSYAQNANSIAQSLINPPSATPTIIKTSTGAAPSSSGTFLPTEPAAPTTEPGPLGASRAHISVEAILGIVFGVIAFVGAVVGALVWRNRQRRVLLNGERE